MYHTYYVPNKRSCEYYVCCLRFIRLKKIKAFLKSVQILAAFRVIVFQLKQNVVDTKFQSKREGKFCRQFRVLMQALQF